LTYQTLSAVSGRPAASTGFASRPPTHWHVFCCFLHHPFFREVLMSDRHLISRRQALHGIGAAAASTALVPFGARPAFAKDLVVGFLYVGPKDDYGYNQAHAEGAAAVRSMPGLKLLEE